MSDLFQKKIVRHCAGTIIKMNLVLAKQFKLMPTIKYIRLGQSTSLNSKINVLHYCANKRSTLYLVSIV